MVRTSTELQNLNGALRCAFHNLELSSRSEQQLDACKELAQIERWTEWLLLYDDQDKRIDLSKMESEK